MEKMLNANQRLPIIFGNERCQRILLEAYENGENPNGQVDKVLYGSGLAYRFKRDGRVYTALDDRHPSFDLVLAVLGALSGKPRGAPPAERPDGPHEIKPEYPLCHFAKHDFRALQRVSEAGEDGLDLAALKAGLHDVWAQNFGNIPDRLVSHGSLRLDSDGRYRLGAGVPTELAALVGSIATVLAETDPRFAPDRASHRRTAAHVLADDELPILFGTDLRFRLLMALAVHGPTDLCDLRRIVGGQATIPPEGRYGRKPFGDSRVVVTFPTESGYAAALDPRFPCIDELRAFLLRMERAYPLPPLVRLYPVPDVPVLDGEWRGVPDDLFGGEIPTRILATLGVLGWTYESLCVDAAGHDRVPVKRKLFRFEEQGALVSHGDRRPGMDVRLVTVSEALPAHDEFYALLRAFVAAFPFYVEKTRRALYDSKNPETKQRKWKTVEHLRLRGLLPERPAEGAEPTLPPFFVPSYSPSPGRALGVRVRDGGRGRGQKAERKLDRHVRNAMRSLGKAVARRRIDRRMRQRDLALAASVSLRTVNNVEAGELISMGNLRYIASALGKEDALTACVGELNSRAANTVALMRDAVKRNAVKRVQAAFVGAAPTAMYRRRPKRTSDKRTGLRKRISRGPQRPEAASLLARVASAIRTRRLALKMLQKDVASKGSILVHCVKKCERDGGVAMPTFEGICFAIGVGERLAHLVLTHGLDSGVARLSGFVVQALQKGCADALVEMFADVEPAVELDRVAEAAF